MAVIRPGKPRKWAELAAAVRTRREAMRLGQSDLAGRGGPSAYTLRKIERGEPGPYRPRTLTQLEEALDWPAGAVDLILAGDATKEQLAAVVSRPVQGPAADLDARGQAFWDHVTAEFELDAPEQELLRQVCRVMDRCDALRAEVVSHGATVTGPRGDRRPNPALAEERQQSLTLGRLLAQLQLPAEDGATLASPTQVRARKASQQRWTHHKGTDVSAKARQAASARWRRGGDAGGA
ncbi:MAG: helix-turn-helix domain-containing protein [Pseudonocardiaceae bacterium]